MIEYSDEKNFDTIDRFIEKRQNMNRKSLAVSAKYTN